ncbi:MAG: T9SS type A sorting domain-containing protein [Bacteroidetes bacterium]|nr:T9SS type A sorting domain-containing protein [Bacteroidota bacterium]
MKTFEITDLLGKVYLVGNALGVNSFEQVGISSLTSGIYLINFADNKGNRLSLKFIKQ